MDVAAQLVAGPLHGQTWTLPDERTVWRFPVPQERLSIFWTDPRSSWKNHVVEYVRLGREYVTEAGERLYRYNGEV